jgi:hypothetical protein
LFDNGILNKIKFGVKVLGNGADKLATISQRFNTPIRLEASDATA